MLHPFIKLMKALSDPNRVLILKMLQHKMMCVSEIQAALQIAQPTVSKHLKILSDAGLVTSKKDGLWMNYRPSERNNSPYVDSILGNLRHWLEDDPRVARMREKLPGIRRENLNTDKYSAAFGPE
jgi:ArsR family transcriptional regulator